MTEVLFLSAIFGVLSCDTVVAGQFMYSRPLIAGPLAGLCLGNPYVGFIAGLCVELIWIRVIPIGDSVPPDSTLTAVLASAAAAAAVKNFGIDNFSAIVAALAVSVPCGIVFKIVEMKIRAANSKTVDDIKVKIIRGDFSSVDRGTFYAVVRKFLISAVFFLLAYILVTALPEFYWRVPDTAGGVEIIMRFIYILCFAQLFEMFLKWK
ncbi:MAG: PTS sugar transporter subunit IIC [Elusimicrobiota bacterium]|nr:PTS sugar transporter subunit IIC [Elusimicrobiota bacterium]